MSLAADLPPVPANEDALRETRLCGKRYRGYLLTAVPVDGGCYPG
jgi:hypothetical protein